jgi:hypothetical protein
MGHNCSKIGCAKCTEKAERKFVKSFNDLNTAARGHRMARHELDELLSPEQIKDVRVAYKIGQARIYRPDYVFTEAEKQAYDPKWLFEDGPYVPVTPQ